jgi:hypothetical protein
MYKGSSTFVYQNQEWLGFLLHGSKLRLQKAPSAAQAFGTIDKSITGVGSLAIGI